MIDVTLSLDNQRNAKNESQSQDACWRQRGFGVCFHRLSVRTLEHSRHGSPASRRKERPMECTKQIQILADSRSKLKDSFRTDDRPVCSCRKPVQSSNTRIRGIRPHRGNQTPIHESRQPVPLHTYRKAARRCETWRSGEILTHERSYGMSRMILNKRRYLLGNNPEAKLVSYCARPLLDV